MNMVINYAAFGILTLLWLGFGAALLFNRTALDTIWQAFQAFPLVVQVVVGLIVLPVALGLWIWESELPVWLRLVLVVGLAFVTVYVFMPNGGNRARDVNRKEE